MASILYHTPNLYTHHTSDKPPVAECCTFFSCTVRFKRAQSFPLPFLFGSYHAKNRNVRKRPVVQSAERPQGYGDICNADNLASDEATLVHCSISSSTHYARIASSATDLQMGILVPRTIFHLLFLFSKGGAVCCVRKKGKVAEWLL